VSCICGYLHFTRDLQYESFYLSQYILQFTLFVLGGKRNTVVCRIEYEKMHTKETAKQLTRFTPNDVTMF